MEMVTHLCFSVVSFMDHCYLCKAWSTSCQVCYHFYSSAAFSNCILPALMPKPAAVINFRGIIYYPMGITPVFIDWEEVSHIQLYDLNTILLLGIGSKDFKSVLARARWYDRLSLQLAANSYPLPLSIPINYLSLSKKEVLKQLEKYYQYKILYQS